MGSFRGMTSPPAEIFRRFRPDFFERNRLPLIVALLLPGSASAEACDTLAPAWDGTRVSALAEALALAGSLPALALLIATAFVVRWRSQWGGLAVTVGWSCLVYVLVFWRDPSGMRDLAIQEGCIGTPALFIAAVAAICIGTIIYTAPAERRSKNQE